MLNAIATIFFWAFFLISGVVFQLFLLIRLLGIREESQRHRMAQKFRLLWSAFNLRLFFGVESIKSLRQQSESLPNQFILITNHRSNLDPLFVFVIGRPLVFLSKKAVLKSPVIGWWMRLCGDVAVDRGEKSSRQESLASMKERLERGDSLLIFPEGTRQTDTNVPLGEFKDGAFNLASQCGVPLVALVLEQTDRIWQKGSLVLRIDRLRYAISGSIPSLGRTPQELKEQSITTMRSMIQTFSAKE
ncbi:MAG: lysophospholipid acyltransferase family protein [Silvanigrellaceae bacterium]